MLRDEFLKALRWLFWRDGLPVPAVDRRHLEFCELDAVDAGDVERDHGRAVGLLPRANTSTPQSLQDW